MSYLCQTSGCSIAKSGATFPSMGDCPVCHLPLSYSLFLAADDQFLIESLPYVIAYPLKQTLLEDHPWIRINLMKDTFLNFLKYLALISASEFFNSQFANKKLVELFYKNLTDPGFGGWNTLIRETLSFLCEKKHSFICKVLPLFYESIELGSHRMLYQGEIEFIDSIGDFHTKKQEATGIGMMINFRNKYLGHGLTLDAATSQSIWDQYFPILRTMLELMKVFIDYPMYKQEENTKYILQSSEIYVAGSPEPCHSGIWVQSESGEKLPVLPFYIVPGEIGLETGGKAKVFIFESNTGKTIKFFSPEGIVRETSGILLEKLNLLLKSKSREKVLSPDQFTIECFKSKAKETSKLLLLSLEEEKKIIPGVYIHRNDMEIKLREWIGARSSIFFIAAEAGSGKTNLLSEIYGQYLGRGLTCLFIRASRLRTNNLREDLSEILDLDTNYQLKEYASIAGTQIKPVIILLDSLNESRESIKLWEDIKSISRDFEPGSLNGLLLAGRPTEMVYLATELSKRIRSFCTGWG